MAGRERGRRSWWGWGLEEDALPAAEVDALGALVAARLDGATPERRDPARVEDLRLPAPRLRPPAALARMCSDDERDRATHAQGRSFRDVVRAFHGRVDHPPDVVARPRSEDEVAAVLEWCSDAGIAVIPYGGGSSVVGGVEPDVGDGYRGVVTLDLGDLDAVLEVDIVSRAARVQAGALGPDLEADLRRHGLTLRHFPQSFEHSTLGGWIATRSGGHYATVRTHIDDFVESLRAVTPAGVLETRRLPASGAGPDPNRLLLGSEGTLGVVTEAWVRLQARPVHRASATFRLPTFGQAVAATRDLAQSGLEPANCRLLDAGESMVSGAGDGRHPLLVVAFESADHPLDAWMARAVEIAGDHGGEPTEPPRLTGDGEGARQGSAGRWRGAFLRGPYIRDALVSLGLVSETFETAVTWERFEAFHTAVTDAVGVALREVCGGGTVTCRFTHVYPDGPAPYYTVLAPSRHGSQLEQWAEVKAAASEAVLAGGATITHHHAVGRDHRRWYDRERPDLFASALTAAKAVLDPAGVLNPGVLLPAPPRTVS